MEKSASAVSGLLCNCRSFVDVKINDRTRHAESPADEANTFANSHGATKKLFSRLILSLSGVLPLILGCVLFQDARADELAFVDVPRVWSSSGGYLRSSVLCEMLNDKSLDWENARINRPQTADACVTLAAIAPGADWRSGFGSHASEILQVANAVARLRAYCQSPEKMKSDLLCISVQRNKGFSRTDFRLSAAALDDQSESFSSAMPVTQQAGAAKLSGSVEEQFVQGLTNFILDRAKLEAILHFEERFKEKLCMPDADKGAQVGYFLAVCNVLSNANDAGFSLGAASRDLRAAARADLKELPDNLLHQKYIETGDDIWVMSRTWFAVARAMRDGHISSDAIPEWLASIDAMGLCLRQPGWPSRDADPAAFNAKSEETCSTALRALGASGALIVAVDRLASGKGLATDLADAIALLSDAAHQAMSAPAKWSELLGRLDSLKAAVPRLKTLDATIRSNFLAIREANASELRKARRVAAHTLIEVADEILTLTDDVAVAITGCDSASCGFDGETAARKLTRSVATVRKYDDIVVSILENDWANVASRFSELFLRDSKQAHATGAIGRFAPVVSELAGAGSAVEVQSILNNAAAPAGSYREKFQSRTRSITAFAGVSMGRERNDVNHEWGDTRGLFLPVGLHITWPCERNCYGFGQGARGVFFSVIDVGPYADYRDTGPDVDRDTSLGFKQLFAPGAYLTWNISTNHTTGANATHSLAKTLDDLFYRSPFVFGIGVVRAPALVDATTGDTVRTTRVQAFFAIDVTMFPF